MARNHIQDASVITVRKVRNGFIIEPPHTRETFANYAEAYVFPSLPELFEFLESHGFADTEE